MKTKAETCMICKKPFTGIRYAVGKEPGDCCEQCWAKRGPKRDQRSAWRLRQDILEKRYAEMRAAIEQRDRYRREAEAVKQQLRDEVREEVIAAVRQLSLWRRLMLCFSPFQTQL